jgi:dihydrolipoamide dehydrogenase
MEKFDVVVIGGGPAGYPAAIRSAQLGAKIALVEKGEVGGVCLNTGCIPTKALISGAELFAGVMGGKLLGVKADKISFDYSVISQHKDKVVSQLRRGVETLLNSYGVHVFKGVAVFDSRNKIVIRKPVTSDTRKQKEEIIVSNSVIIATGSQPIIPEGFPVSPRVIDSTGFLKLTSLPASLVIVGGGVVGCEVACLSARLGVRVTIVELLEDILFMLDEDIRREIRKYMEDVLSIRILTGASISKVMADKNKVTTVIGEEAIQSEMMLVATGRRPATQELALEKAGVKVDSKGAIQIDEFCRTTSATIFAAGDVTGKWQLAHAATAQGITAAENACSSRRVSCESIVPVCLFTSPEAGAVGLTEQEAKKRGIEYKVGKFPFSALGRALAGNEPNGFAKIIADSSTGQILGAHVVGTHATELIAEAVLAVRGEFTLEELASTVHCHPTYSEIWAESARVALGTSWHLTKRPVRKVH